MTAKGESRSGGMTQQEVADELGITRAYVSMIECRALKKLRVAAEARGMTLDEVFFREPETTNPRIGRW